MKILLLEDEFLLASSIRTFLLARGYLVDYFDNGVSVLEAIKELSYDFYLLDINTPLVGGLECLKEIRTKYPQAPVMIISAYHDIGNISDAFGYGCSDYFKKPFNLKELQIRIERLTSMIPEQAPATQSNLIKLSHHYTFDRERNFLYFDGLFEKFSKREYALITLFVSNLSQIMSDDTIRRFIWDDEEIETATVRSLINRIRKRLKEPLIENVRGLGYVMRPLL